jgi:hypothetical protein
MEVNLVFASGDWPARQNWLQTADLKYYKLRNTKIYNIINYLYRFTALNYKIHPPTFDVLVMLRVIVLSCLGLGVCWQCFIIFGF